ELQKLKSQLGLDFKALQKVGARAAGLQMRPFISTCSAQAKLLHFNGSLKPWRKEKWDKKQIPPLCLAQSSASLGLSWHKEVQGKTFGRCVDLWSGYLSETSAKLLKMSVSSNEPSGG
ncbi:unnamed protein product, partial [Polarella glacialis]